VTATRVARTEISKLTTSTVPKAAFAVGVLVVAVLAGLYAVFSREIVRGDAAGLALPDVLLNVHVTGFRYGFVLVVLLGVHLVAGDLREGTLLVGLLGTPRRGTLLTGKVLAAVAAGLAVGGVLLLTSVAVGAAGAAVQGVPQRLLTDDVPLTLVTAWLGAGLLSVVGLGIGAIFRRELVAVVVALVWLLLVDGVVAGLLDQGLAWGHVSRFLPGSLVAALSGGVQASGGAQTLAPGTALLALAGYAAVAWGVGAIVVRRRDFSAGRDR